VVRSRTTLGRLPVPSQERGNASQCALTNIVRPSLVGSSCDVDRPSAMRISCRQGRELQEEGRHRSAKTQARQNGSKGGAVPSFKLFICPFARRIQTACTNIRLNLSIPLVGSEFLKPSNETTELGLRQFRNSRFDLFDAHTRKITGGVGAATRKFNPSNASKTAFANTVVLTYALLHHLKKLAHYSPLLLLFNEAR